MRFVRRFQLQQSLPGASDLDIDQAPDNSGDNLEPAFRSLLESQVERSSLRCSYRYSSCPLLGRCCCTSGRFLLLLLLRLPVALLLLLFLLLLRFASLLGLVRMSFWLPWFCVLGVLPREWIPTWLGHLRWTSRDPDQGQNTKLPRSI